MTSRFSFRRRPRFFTISSARELIPGPLFQPQWSWQFLVALERVQRSGLYPSPALCPHTSPVRTAAPSTCYLWFRLQHELLTRPDRKSTRLNSSHVAISYAVFCLKKKSE